MVFFKLTAALSDRKWANENSDRNVKYERIREINEKADGFNRKNRRERCFFMSGLGRNDVTCGVISVSAEVPEKEARAFLKAVELDVKDIKLEEITFFAMRRILSEADRNDYILNDDEYLERYGLETLCNRFFRDIELGENLLDEGSDRESLYASADKLLANDTLRPELDRIYSGKPPARAFGHPVHYFLECDDIFTRKKLSRVLMEALYDRNRLRSRRYCFVDVRPRQDFSRSLFDNLYKSSADCAVLVRYHADDDSEDGEFASDEADVISGICETVLRYRNQVLTLICLPRACEKAKKQFVEYLGPLGMVTVREDLADNEKACEYLKTLCKERHVRPDKKLFSALDADKLYYPDELRTVFDEWFNLKIKTSIFPQYRDVASCRREAVKERTRGSAFDELNEMIGLAGAKAVIGKALNYYKLQKICRDKGADRGRPAMHMVFTGNPGTAKTTVARLFARIMKENGLLSKGHLVEVGRGDLVGKYVGWTAQTVKDKFKTATGGVLFIDEAYSLVDDREGMFGDEAINTIVQEMENRREDLVVIFAGYPREMDAFLSRNPGLRSRIAFHVPFADYSAEELCGIARIIGKSKGVTFTDAAVAKLSVIFEAARQQTGFGNGRYVRNVIELSKMNQADRLVGVDPDKITEKTISLIEDVDIEVPVVREPTAKKLIGFAG